MQKQHSQTIGITMGDPCGVGPEVVLKAVDLLTKASEPIEVILIGSRAVFEEAARAIGIPFQELKGKSANVRILDTGDSGLKRFLSSIQYQVSDSYSSSIVFTSPNSVNGLSNCFISPITSNFILSGCKYSFATRSISSLVITFMLST